MYKDCLSLLGSQHHMRVSSSSNFPLQSSSLSATKFLRAGSTLSHNYALSSPLLPAMLILKPAESAHFPKQPVLGVIYYFPRHCAICIFSQSLFKVPFQVTGIKRVKSHRDRTNLCRSWLETGIPDDSSAGLHLSFGLGLDSFSMSQIDLLHFQFLSQDLMQYQVLFLTRVQIHYQHNYFL